MWRVDTAAVRPDTAAERPGTAAGLPGYAWHWPRFLPSPLRSWKLPTECSGTSNSSAAIRSISAWLARLRAWYSASTRLSAAQACRTRCWIEPSTASDSGEAYMVSSVAGARQMGQRGCKSAVELALQRFHRITWYVHRRQKAWVQELGCTAGHLTGSQSSCMHTAQQSSSGSCVAPSSACCETGGPSGILYHTTESICESRGRSSRPAAPAIRRRIPLGPRGSRDMKTTEPCQPTN